MKCLATVLTALLLTITCAAETFRLIPTPKKFAVSKETVTYAKTFSIENKIAEFSPQEMICDHLSELGMRCNKESKGSLHIRFVPGKSSDFPTGNKESYSLKLDKNGVVISSITPSGAWLGAGRLLAVLSGPDTVIDEKSIKLPALEISDYPDLETRAMKIELPTTSGAELFKAAKPMIRTLTMFGFNIAFIDFRGNLECKKYPHLAQEPILPQKDLAELIRYARACGLEVLPWTNTIGHLGRAPLIFPLKGNSTLEWAKKKNNNYVVMDIFHKDFYNVLFDYFDEVLTLFGNPGYICISCDEFHDGLKILKTKTKKSYPEFFAEYITKVNQYLGKRSCKAIIAQDMLFPRQTPWYINGPANGPADALKTLDLISKDTSIMMWKYNYDEEYPHLTTLKQKNFTDVWCAPWFEPEATAALSKRCHQLNMKLLGTTWWYYPQVQGIPTVGEFAWNAAKPVVRENAWYDAIIDHYYFRTKPLPAGTVTTPAKVIGGKAIPAELAEKYAKISPLFTEPQMFDAPHLLLKEILPPWDFKQLAKEGNIGVTFGNSPLLQTRKHTAYNVLREINTLVFFDRNHGKSTGSNIYGAEIAVTGNKISEVSGVAMGRRELEKGNMAIPENGVVLSFHGKLSPVSGRLTRNLQIKKGMSVKLYRLPSQKMPKTPAKAIVCRFSGKKPNVRIYVTSTMPFKQRESLALLRIDSTTRGKTMTFNSNQLLSGGAPSSSGCNFSVVKSNDMTINQVICIEYNAKSPKEYPKRAVFTARQEGAISGFTVLGAEEF